jgi:hypothetical protein
MFARKPISEMRPLKLGMAVLTEIDDCCINRRIKLFNNDISTRCRNAFLPLRREKHPLTRISSLGYDEALLLSELSQRPGHNYFRSCGLTL